MLFAKDKLGRKEKKRKEDIKDIKKPLTRVSTAATSFCPHSGSQAQVQAEERVNEVNKESKSGIAVKHKVSTGD